jgi:hypothetical protein
MPRFTLSLHAGGKEEDHYDLFLEHGDALKTWRLRNAVFSPPQACVLAKDHRKTYLDFEGEVSGKRGHVAVWDTGTYVADVWSDDLIQVALQGRKFRGRLRLERDAAKAEEGIWTVSDAAAGIRKSAASFLRGDPLDPAPTPELDALREALAAEERRLMAQVDLFARGGHVNWAQAELNPELAPRLDAERVRWQHPWLAGAKRYVERLGEMASLLAQVKPPA